MEPIIQVRGLSKSYAGIPAVNGIDFELMQGQCFGLLGPNGAGKTTTIEILEGISQPDSGQILYYSQPINRKVLGKIGIQFQHTAIQDFLTVRETLNLFRALYSDPLSNETLIEMCQLESFIDKDHKKLSGGQKQRLLLALALVNDPDILFLDEPTTGLDPQARRKFWTLINRIKQTGKSILLTTHYMDEAEQLCDRIVVMSQGKIIERGEPKALLNKHFPGVLVQLQKQRLPSALSDTHQIVERPDHLEFATEDLQHTLGLLVSGGVELGDIRVKSANLEDLFLKLTGQGLGESA